MVKTTDSSSTDNRQASSRMRQLTLPPTSSCNPRGQLNGGIHRKGALLKKTKPPHQQVIRSIRVNVAGDREVTPLCEHAQHNMNRGATVTELPWPSATWTPTVRVPGWPEQSCAKYSPVFLNGIVTTDYYYYYYYYYHHHHHHLLYAGYLYLYS